MLEIIVHKFAVNIGNYLQLGFWVFPDAYEHVSQRKTTTKQVRVAIIFKKKKKGPDSH